MSSAPNHGTVSETGLSSTPPPALSLGGHVQQVFSHVKIGNLVAGLSGGVVSTLVLHPLDLVKIRFAVSDGLMLRPKYSGIMHCMKSVWQQEGLRGLYQGVTPNVWGAGASWGLYFLFYNAIKGYIKEGRQTELSATEHLVSAAQAGKSYMHLETVALLTHYYCPELARADRRQITLLSTLLSHGHMDLLPAGKMKLGIITLTITNPIWVTKTRLVLQYNADPSGKQYKGMLDALVKIYRHEGVPGLYKGYVPGLFGTSHGALQFMAYEELKRDYNKYRKVPSDAKLNALEYITMAALSKIFAVATTYPYQVVRARLQDQHNRYNGVMDVIGRTWRNEGAIGFYKGIIPNLIRVTPACCITFVVYENVSRLLLEQKK